MLRAMNDVWKVPKVIEFLNEHLQSFEDFTLRIKELQREHVAEHQDIEKRYEQLELQWSHSEKQYESELQDIKKECQLLVEGISKIAFQAKSHSEYLIEIERLHNDYEQLKNTNDYMTMLDFIHKLVETTRAYFKKSPKAALQPLSQFQAFKVELKKKNYTHLSNYLNEQMSQLTATLKNEFTENLRHALRELGYPKFKVSHRDNQKMEVDKYLTFKEAMEDLLLFQNPMNEVAIDDEGHWDRNNLPDLYVMHVLLEPLWMRFKYHFETHRPTNRRDKPEWVFTYIVNLIQDHWDFMTDEVQNILDEQQLAIYQAKDEFIKGLVTEMKIKFELDLQKFLAEPNLLSHTINEALLFQQTLKNNFDFDEENYRIVDVFIGREENFQTWLQIEYQFAQETYEELMSAEGVWDLRYSSELAEIDEIRPTQSVENLVNLLQAVTDRYRYLSSMKHKLSFFELIQKELIQKYVAEIELLVKEISNWGIKDVTQLQQLTKLANSLAYGRSTFKDWSEQIFFTDLWFHSRNSEVKDVEWETSTLFDELCLEYLGVEDQIIDLILGWGIKTFVGVLKPYRKRLKAHSTSQPHENRMDHQQSKDTTGIPIEFIDALTHIKHYLNVLEGTAGKALFDKLWKRIAATLDEYLFEQVVIMHGHVWNEISAAQFRFGMDRLYILFRPWTKKPENYFKRTKEACILLDLSHHKNEMSAYELYTVLCQDEVANMIHHLSKLSISRLNANEVLSVLEHCSGIRNE